MGPSVDVVSPLDKEIADDNDDSGEGLLSTAALTLLELYTAQVEDEVTGQKSSKRTTVNTARQIVACS